MPLARTPIVPTQKGCLSANWVTGVCYVNDELHCWRCRSGGKDSFATSEANSTKIFENPSHHKDSRAGTKQIAREKQKRKAAMVRLSALMSTLLLSSSSAFTNVSPLRTVSLGRTHGPSCFLSLVALTSKMPMFAAAGSRTHLSQSYPRQQHGECSGTCGGLCGHRVQCGGCGSVD